jgi:hypothetical protein
MLQSLKTIRTLIIAEYVPHEFRTEVMSLHALMTPLGALIGPLVWLLVERYPADHLLVGSLRVNKYTLDYGVATCILLVIASIAMVRLGRLPGQQHAHSLSSDSSGEIGEREPLNGSENGTTALASQHESSDYIHVSLTDGREFDVNPDRYRRRIFIYFSVVMACVNISMGLYSVSWQPIMVNVFEADGQKLGIIFEIISVFAIIPPLLVLPFQAPARPSHPSHRYHSKIGGHHVLLADLWARAGMASCCRLYHYHQGQHILFHSLDVLVHQTPGRTDVWYSAWSAELRFRFWTGCRSNFLYRYHAFAIWELLFRHLRLACPCGAWTCPLALVLDSIRCKQGVHSETAGGI